MEQIIDETKANSLLLNAIMENCEEIITIKDLNYRYISCNDAFLEHFNLKSREEAIGKSIFEFLPKENASCIKENIEKSIRTKKPSRYKMHIIKDNINTIVQQTSSPVLDNGKIKYILTISRDITNDELIREELISKNNLLNSLLEYTPVMIYMKNKKKEYILGSKYAKDFAFKGYDRHVDCPRLDMENCANLTDEEDGKVIENKELILKEKCVLDFEKNPHWYNLVKAPVLKENGEVDGIITITRNIDRQKELENQKDIFVATLVHDLKNPLLAQISCLDLFKKGRFGALNEIQNEMLENTLESANYMKEMLFTMINTYKYESGNITLSKVETDIEALIKTCVKEASSMACERDIKLTIENNLKDNNIYMDSKQIRRVISNLLNNGINYAHEHTEFKIVLKENGENIEVALTNKGPLIDEKTKEHLFEKYITGANRYQKIGFGLGMYLSKKIIQAHDGDIWYKGENDSSTFTFSLPRKDLVKAKVKW